MGIGQSRTFQRRARGAASQPEENQRRKAVLRDLARIPDIQMVVMYPSKILETI